jgi:dTDP-4-amino-4,6-dideoxygalactose transaminase
VGRNDLVLVPNLTFIASLNSVLYTGAEPILFDCDSGTWQLDANLLERFLKDECEVREDQCYHIKLNRRIPVIMPVHVLGNIGEIDRILDLATEFKITVLEDSTEALGSYYNGKHAGSFGAVGTFSFNGNKLITTGGGGMIVTNDDAFAQHAKHVTTQAKSDPMEYFHDEMGFNYRLTNVAAAMGVAQMEQLDEFLAAKKRIRDRYVEELDGIGDITFQEILDGCQPNHWLFTFRTTRMRQLLNDLNSKRLQSRPFWVPMNRLPMFESAVYINDVDQSGKLYSEALSVPCSTNLTDDEQSMVIDAIKSVFA